jgi:hypothetical protein
MSKYPKEVEAIYQLHGKADLCLDQGPYKQPFKLLVLRYKEQH